MNMLSKRVVVVVAVAVGLASCGDDGGSTKAGSTSSPVTLRIGTDDPPGRPTEQQIVEFARHVDELSAGEVKIEPVFQAGGEDNKDWDQVVGRMVVSGELDMGLIPARAWDTEGVKSLRALNAPFLVDSDALVEEVVTSELAGEMLAGLEAVDVTGLALLPEGMRHLFVFGGPGGSLSDLDGKVVRAPHSATAYALYEALGAIPGDHNGDAFAAGVADGTIHAAESSFALAGTLPAISSAYANTTLFPKVNSLVINSNAFARLRDDHQRALRHAATRTVDWTIEQVPSETDGARWFCDNGGTVVLATDAEVETLREAAEPVYDQLEQDEPTKEMIERIRAMKAELPAASAVAPCAPSESTTTEPVSDVAVELDGVYRAEVSLDLLLDAGVDRVTASGHAGVWTLTFDGGTLKVEDVNAATGETKRDQGVYCVAGSRVSVGLQSDPRVGGECGDFWTASWTVDGDQLQFTDVQSAVGYQLLIETIYGGTPFTKID